MAYETSLTTPTEVNQGEEVIIGAFIECTRDSGQCDTHTFELDIDGEVVFSGSFSLRPTVFEIPMSVATTEVDDWEIWDLRSLSRKYRATTTHNLGRDFHGVAVKQLNRLTERVKIKTEPLFIALIRRRQSGRPCRRLLIKM